MPIVISSYNLLYPAISNYNQLYPIISSKVEVKHAASNDLEAQGRVRGNEGGDRGREGDSPHGDG